MKFLLITAFLFLTRESLPGQTSMQNPEDAAILNRAEKVLTDIIVHDIFSPPVASRIYVYANISAYEILVKTNDSCKSLYGLISSLPKIESPSRKISFQLAAIYSFLLTGKKMVFSEPAMEDSIRAILKMFKRRGLSSTMFSASLEYGQRVSNAIVGWASKDQYNETRKLKRYQFSKYDGKWIPTPPGYMAAVEPYWGQIRTLVLDSAKQFKPGAAEQFSKDKSSAFYKQAYEVYSTVNNLNNEQKNIANFWDCNPFFLNTEGHLNFGTKKISPGGHWILITGILCRQQNADLMKTSAVYTYVSIALFDSFISCWEEKYSSNVIRPESYINSYIDESWRPLLQTPPFPEHTSGHSVVSAASAAVLTRIFGEQVPFTDNSETEFGLPSRKFSSINEARDEAAVSRLYGGIHYRPAIKYGLLQGDSIGKYIVAKLVNRAFL